MLSVPSLPAWLLSIRNWECLHSVSTMDFLNFHLDTWWFIVRKFTGKLFRRLGENSSWSSLPCSVVRRCWRNENGFCIAGSSKRPIRAVMDTQNAQTSSPILFSRGLAITLEIDHHPFRRVHSSIIYFLHAIFTHFIVESLPHRVTDLVRKQ